MQPLPLIVLIGGLLSGSPLATQAQSYRLTSWEGRPQTVSLSYKLFSKRLAVSCAGDSLFLLNYTGTTSVQVLHGRFLQITYATRCGTNCRTENTVLLTLRQHRFQVPLLVLSTNEWSAFSDGDARTRRYRVRLAMPNGAADFYTLRAQVQADDVPRQPAKHAFQQVTLRLDPVHHVFYTALEPTARCLPVYEEAGTRPFPPGDRPPLPLVPAYAPVEGVAVVPHCVAGTVPVVRLVGQLYYYLQGAWYEGPEKPAANEPYWFTTNAVSYMPKATPARIR